MNNNLDKIEKEFKQIYIFLMIKSDLALNTALHLNNYAIDILH